MEVTDEVTGPTVATFDDFSPDAYLGEYYSSVGEENDALLRFLVDAFSNVTPGGRMIELGCGPTIYQLLAAARVVDTVALTDPVVSNLAVIERWLRAEPEAFDWRPFIERTLAYEGGSESPEAVARRADLLRSKVGWLGPCDLLAPAVLPGSVGLFDVVGLHFVTEGITSDRATWAAALDRVLGLVAPEGWIVTAAVERATHWKVGSRAYPAVSLDVDDLVDHITASGFSARLVRRTDAEHPDPSSPQHEGYSGLMFVAAQRLG